MRRVTYAPRKGGKYRVQINGKPQPGKGYLLTKAQILAQGMEFLANGQTFSISRQTEKIAPPKKNTVSRHPSDYQKKQRRGR